jgi:hypothetical protein
MGTRQIETLATELTKNKAKQKKALLWEQWERELIIFV